MELVGSTMRAIITAVLKKDINKFNLLNLPFKHKASTLTGSIREREMLGWFAQNCTAARDHRMAPKHRQEELIYWLSVSASWKPPTFKMPQNSMRGTIGNPRSPLQLTTTLAPV